MPFYDGLRFLFWAGETRRRSWIDKHYDEYAVVFYLHRGTIDFAIGDEEPRQIKGPVLQFRYPGPRFRSGVRDRRVQECYFVAIAGDRLQAYLDQGLFPCEPRSALVPIRDDEFYKSKWIDLIAYLDKRGHTAPRAINLFEGILLLVDEVGTAGEDSAGHRKAITSLRNAIKAEPAYGWDFQLEAERMRLSYDHFRRLFRHYCGVAPQQFVSQCCMNMAARLLVVSTDDIEAIAAKVGFADLPYFWRQFKKVYGMPPARYRRQFGNLTTTGPQR